MKNLFKMSTRGTDEFGDDFAAFTSLIWPGKCADKCKQQI